MFHEKFGVMHVYGFKSLEGSNVGGDAWHGSTTHNSGDYGAAEVVAGCAAAPMDPNGPPAMAKVVPLTIGRQQSTDKLATPETPTIAVVHTRGAK